MLFEGPENRISGEHHQDESGSLFKGHAFDNRPIAGIGNSGTLFRTTHQVTKR